MGAPSVEYRLLTDGYEITSGDDGFQAKASFICGWGDAFTMHDEIMGIATAAVVGPVSYTGRWQFPGSSTARLYAMSCRITPFALDGGPYPITAALGLAAGEFWSHARLDVVFATPAYAQSAADDPGGIASQLDPANPLTYCEQSIRSGGTMETQHKGGYEWDPSDTADLTKIKQDLAVFVPESRLVLSFPRLPFLPWARVQEYLGSLNDRTILQCPAETLLFEEAETKFAATNQGLMGQSFQMTLAHSKTGWNKIFNPTTGLFNRVRKVGSTSKSIYEVKDWRPMFA